MKRILIVCLLLTAGTTLQNAYAQDETLIKTVTAGSGQARGGIEIWRLGFRTTPHLLFHSESAHLTFGYEASVSHLVHGDEGAAGIALSPVFVCYLGPKSNSVRPYLEAGLGVAAISDTEIANRDLSSSFHFENRVGIGIRGRGYDLNLRYLHYSNSGLKEPNEGLDILMVSFGHGFVP
ncbi:MAG: acyloxyacyl hydrolase [Candidatus Eiseniibacteriota bacterium]|nr:MAG: acyloxyacyl hydrolase [Candidatus Eisenbacteria bacterium]